MISCGPLIHTGYQSLLFWTVSWLFQQFSSIAMAQYSTRPLRDEEGDTALQPLPFSASQAVVGPSSSALMHHSSATHSQVSLADPTSAPMQVDPTMVAIDAEEAFNNPQLATAVRERMIVAPDGTQACEVISVTVRPRQPRDIGSPPRRHVEHENQLLHYMLAHIQQEANTALQQQRPGFEQAAAAYELEAREVARHHVNEAHIDGARRIANIEVQAE